MADHMNITPTNPTAWALISAALTMLTLPGVALFYGGMVRRKNVINTIGLSFFTLILSMPVAAAWIGMGTNSFTALSTYGLTGALALALLTGACVERLRWSFSLCFGIAWLALVFHTVADSLWG